MERPLTASADWRSQISKSLSYSTIKRPFTPRPHPSSQYSRLKKKWVEAQELNSRLKVLVDAQSEYTNQLKGKALAQIQSQGLQLNKNSEKLLLKRKQNLVEQIQQSIIQKQQLQSDFKVTDCRLVEIEIEELAYFKKLGHHMKELPKRLEMIRNILLNQMEIDKANEQLIIRRNALEKKKATLLQEIRANNRQQKRLRSDMLRSINQIQNTTKQKAMNDMIQDIKNNELNRYQSQILTLQRIKKEVQDKIDELRYTQIKPGSNDEILQSFSAYRKYFTDNPFQEVDRDPVLQLEGKNLLDIHISIKPLVDHKMIRRIGLYLNYQAGLLKITGRELVEKQFQGYAEWIVYNDLYEIMQKGRFKLSSEESEETCHYLINSEYHKIYDFTRFSIIRIKSQLIVLTGKQVFTADEEPEVFENIALVFEKARNWLRKGFEEHFGGKVSVSSADVKQILKVVPQLGKKEIHYINMCLFGQSGKLQQYSYRWLLDNFTMPNHASHTTWRNTFSQHTT